MDIVYHSYAKNIGLSDMSFWILYIMADTDKLFTQRDFCKEWLSAPQTVNSALKALEKKGIIFLEQVSGNKKNKWIKLTESGREFAETKIIPLIRAEADSFEELSASECELMLGITRKYIQALKEKVKAL